MKKLFVVLIVLMLVGIVTCVQAATVTAKGKVVSIDKNAKTLTLQQDNGEKLVLGGTLKELDKVKVGDAAVVTIKATKKGTLEIQVIRPPAPLSK